MVVAASLPRCLSAGDLANFLELVECEHLISHLTWGFVLTVRVPFQFILLAFLLPFKVALVEVAVTDHCLKRGNATQEPQEFCQRVCNFIRFLLSQSLIDDIQNVIPHSTQDASKRVNKESQCHVHPNQGCSQSNQILPIHIWPKVRIHDFSPLLGQVLGPINKCICSWKVYCMLAHLATPRERIPSLGVSIPNSWISNHLLNRRANGFSSSEVKNMYSVNCQMAWMSLMICSSFEMLWVSSDSMSFRTRS